MKYALFLIVFFQSVLMDAQHREWKQIKVDKIRVLQNRRTHEEDAGLTYFIYSTDLKYLGYSIAGVEFIYKVDSQSDSNNSNFNNSKVYSNIYHIELKRGMGIVVLIFRRSDDSIISANFYRGNIMNSFIF